KISTKYPNIPAVSVDGVFGSQTKDAIVKFQDYFCLSPDGIIGNATWKKLYEIYKTIEPFLFPPEETKPKYPGYIIREGDRGDNVKTIQTWLSKISTKYPNIPAVSVDGIFGSKTKDAIIQFQKTFGLSPDGLVGSLTWDKLYEIYKTIDSPVLPPAETKTPYPGYIIRPGDNGANVKTIQTWLSKISTKYPNIPAVSVDGVFGSQTKDAIVKFQDYFCLSPDGLVGALTWDKLYEIYSSVNK
ncbi:MAG: peptidoglycan-binding domain-containing protein, partial [Clostridium sp.]